MTALRTHYAEISKHFDGADGSLMVEAVARRSGIMRYRSDSGDRLEFVPPDLIDARDESGRPIMGMLAGAPNTNEHPAQVIRYSTDSRKAVQVGKVSEEIHIYSDADGERSVKVRFDVSDPETIADIRNGRKTGVSLGYLCNVVPEVGEYRGQPYTHRQAMPFSIDHLAIVANPRNPGAIITRFDSDDVAWLSDESKADSVAMPIVRVDACCAACSGSKDPEEAGDEPDEPKTKKKKVKTDADESDEDLPTIPVAFPGQVHELSLAQAESLWSDGTIDLIRMDGRDYFVSADLAIDLRNDGIFGGACGSGWEGTRGNCKRKKRSARQIAKTVGKVALAVGALGTAAYVANKIAKNPKKSAALGVAAIGAGVLLRRSAANRSAKSKEASLKLYRKNLAKASESDRNPQSTASTGKRQLSGAANRTAKSREASLKLMQKNLAKASEENRNESLDRMRKSVTRSVEDNPALAIKKAENAEATRKRRLSGETISDLIGKKEEIEQSPMGWEAKLRLQALNASQARIREERSRGAKEKTTEVPLFSF